VARAYVRIKQIDKIGNDYLQKCNELAINAGCRQATSSALDHSSSCWLRPQTWLEVRPRSRSIALKGWPALFTVSASWRCSAWQCSCSDMQAQPTKAERKPHHGDRIRICHLGLQHLCTRRNHQTHRRTPRNRQGPAKPRRGGPMTNGYHRRRDLRNGRRAYRGTK
jgi:hypothetical protein